MNHLCSDNDLQGITADIQADVAGVPQKLAALLSDFPNDPRLHFLNGSVLAGEGQNIAAHAALSRAVELAPDFAIARFQLGFFQLTSGEAEAALATLHSLMQLPVDHYLRIFTEGLQHLIGDRFEQAVASLQKGIGVNQENIPLNRDMQLIIDECAPILKARQASAQDATVSETSFVLNQFSSDSKPN